LKIRGTENDNEVNRGYIVCSPDNLCGSFNQIIAEVIVLEFPEKLSIIANGFKCTMHYHTAIEEVELSIMAEINKKREENTKVKFIKSNSRAKVLLKTNNLVCGEKFDVCPTLGRFTLRYASTTIAVGKILKYKLGN
jgi:peptide chain release factor subunit 3